jgi:hypothetical protein
MEGSSGYHFGTCMEKVTKIKETGESVTTVNFREKNRTRELPNQQRLG